MENMPFFISPPYQVEMEALIGELDRLCEKFPDRT